MTWEQRKRFDVMTLCRNLPVNETGLRLMDSSLKRSTIYLKSELHRALRIKAADTHRSISDLVNEAILLALREDEEDLSVFASRAKEPELTYEALLRDLKSHGKI
jgi:hypothetical protein